MYEIPQEMCEIANLVVRFSHGMCSYIRVYALVLEPYQFSCSYIRVYAWVLEPYQFSCSYISIFVCVFQHCGRHLREDNLKRKPIVLHMTWVGGWDYSEALVMRLGA